MTLEDVNDQARAGEGPGAADAELGEVPSQLQAQEPQQAQGTKEEEREEGIHTVPTPAAREPGRCSLFWDQRMVQRRSRTLALQSSHADLRSVQG